MSAEHVHHAMEHAEGHGHGVDGHSSAEEMIAGRGEQHERQKRGKWAKLFNVLATPITAPFKGLKYLQEHPVSGTARILGVVGGGVGLAIAKAHYIDGVPMNSLNLENLGHTALTIGPTFAIATGAGAFLGYLGGRVLNTMFDENFQHYSTRKAGFYVGAFLAAFAAFHGHEHGRDYTRTYIEAAAKAPGAVVTLVDAQHDFWFPDRINTVFDPRWELADQPKCLYQDMVHPEREVRCRVPTEAEGIQVVLPPAVIAQAQPQVQPRLAP